MFYKIIMLALLLLLLSDLYAEEVETLEDVVVTARPIGFQSLEHIAQPVTVLKDNELRNKQTNTIGETLSLEPGVTASDFGQGASRPIIRGLGGPRLRVLQGGVGSLDVSSISVDHQVSINPMQADQIEIIRGPATLLYGSGNSAGVVNIVTNRIPEFVPKSSASLDTRFDSARLGPVVGFEAEGGTDHLALHIDTFHQNTGNYESADGDIENSEVEIHDFNIGGSLIDNRGFFGISFGRYESVYEIPFNPEEPDELVFIDLEQKRFDFAGQLSSPLPGFSQVKLRGAYNDYTHTEFEGPGMPGTVFFNDEWEGRLEANHKSIGPWTGIIGLQYRNQSFVAVGDEAFVPGTKLRSMGIFVFEDTDWKNWHFEVGARYENQDTEPTELSGLPEVDHDVYTVSLGTQWQVTDTFSFGINATRAQRAPAIEELFATGPHLASETFEEGDLNLDEETSNNLDFSLSKTDGRLTWTVNLFVNYIEDFIFLQNLDENGDGVADLVDEDRVLGAGELQLVAFQQDNAIFYGTEFEIKLGLIEDNNGKLDFRLFGDWIRAKLDNGDDLPRISPARLGAGLSMQKNRWQASLDGINVFGQDDVAQLETDTGGYILLNAGTEYSISSGQLETRFFARATNLLNEDARRHTSFIKDRAPLLGRSVMAGIQLSY